MNIDLDGRDGNAFSLMATAKRLARQLELDGTAIINEMKDGDYNHLLDTFEKHFGTVVEFENDPR